MTENSTTDPEEGSPGAAEVALDEVSYPGNIDINAFQQTSLIELHKIAQELELRVAGMRSKHQLVFEILKFYGSKCRRCLHQCDLCQKA